MIAVIFEVWPADGRKDDYLGLAASLRRDLERIDGFISVERFQSLTEPGKLLSLSIWRDEDRKSTRLNSSHGYIPYAVFRLKKKTGFRHLIAQPACGNPAALDRCYTPLK